MSYLDFTRAKEVYDEILSDVPEEYRENYELTIGEHEQCMDAISFVCPCPSGRGCSKMCVHTTTTTEFISRRILDASFEMILRPFSHVKMSNIHNCE